MKKIFYLSNIILSILFTQMAWAESENTTITKTLDIHIPNATYTPAFGEPIDL